MIKIPYEVPAEIRDLTEKSVEEARKAFERFVEAAQKASSQAEGTAHILQSSAKDVSARAISFTEANAPSIRSRPKARSREGSAGNPRPSVRIREDAARRHREAGEGAGHRCPDGNAAEKVIPSLHLEGSGLGIGLPMKIATDDFSWPM